MNPEITVLFEALVSVVVVVVVFGVMLQFCLALFKGDLNLRELWAFIKDLLWNDLKTELKKKQLKKENVGDLPNFISLEPEVERKEEGTIRFLDNAKILGISRSLPYKFDYNYHRVDENGFLANGISIVTSKGTFSISSCNNCQALYVNFNLNKKGGF